MSAVAVLPLATTGSQFCVQQVTPDVRTGNSAPLFWPTIQLDILKLVIEQSPRGTLRNWCLVSKFCNSCAIPVLYRGVSVVLKDTLDLRPFECALKSVVKNGGRHCRTLTLSVYPDAEIQDFFGVTPEPEGMIFHDKVDTMVERTIRNIANLRVFSFESWVLPNNDVMRALAESPSLTKLKLRNCESEYGVQNYNDSFNLGGFTHLTSLLLHWVASEFMIRETARVVAACVDLTELSFGYNEDWRDDTDLDLLETLFVGPNGEHLGQKLKRFTTYTWFHDANDFGSSYPSLPIFQNLDSLTVRGIGDPTVWELLAGCKSLRIRKFRLQAKEWHSAREIIGNGGLELLHISLSQPGLNYLALIPLVLKSSSTLRSVRLELGRGTWDRKEVLSQDMANDLVMKCVKLRHLALHADFDTGVWESFHHVLAASCRRLISFSLQGRVLPKPRPAPPQPMRGTKGSRKKKKKVAPQVNPPPAETPKKTPAEYAGELATAYTTAARNRKAVNSLRWIGVDGHKFEVFCHTFSGEATEQWVFSELPKGWSDQRAIGTVVVPDPVSQLDYARGYCEPLFRLAADD